MKQISALFVALLMAATTYGSANHDTARKTLDLRLLARQELFDADWQFSQDSTTWRTVNLPHDWSIEAISTRMRLPTARPEETPRHLCALRMGPRVGHLRPAGS